MKQLVKNNNNNKKTSYKERIKRIAVNLLEAFSSVGPIKQDFLIYWKFLITNFLPTLLQSWALGCDKMS